MTSLLAISRFSTIELHVRVYKEVRSGLGPPNLGIGKQLHNVHVALWKASFIMLVLHVDIRQCYFCWHIVVAALWNLNMITQPALRLNSSAKHMVWNRNLDYTGAHNVSWDVMVGFLQLNFCWKCTFLLQEAGIQIAGATCNFQKV